MEELKNTKDVKSLAQEIYEFYKKENEKNNYGITDKKLLAAASKQAFKEQLIKKCRSGIIDPPENCIDCPLHKLVEYSETESKHVTDKEYVICSVAPAYIFHQPNLKLVTRPSYCPMRKEDEMHETIKIKKFNMKEAEKRKNEE